MLINNKIINYKNLNLLGVESKFQVSYAYEIKLNNTLFHCCWKPLCTQATIEAGEIHLPNTQLNIIRNKNCAGPGKESYPDVKTF